MKYGIFAIDLSKIGYAPPEERTVVAKAVHVFKFVKPVNEKPMHEVICDRNIDQEIRTRIPTESKVCRWFFL